jgi:glycosyltransferase involved in cell wall biosynthesis
MRALQGWLAANRIDLAYVSMLKHDAYVAVGAGRRFGFPVVLRPEGAGATGDIAWQGWGRFGRLIARRCKESDALISISPAIRAELELAGYEPARIFDLPNGVPVPTDPWRPRPRSAESPKAVYVGRLAPEKGLDTLVESWPKVLARYPAATLDLVGEGPEHSALGALAGRLGLGQWVRLAGSVPDPMPLLRAADLFVLPSREEGMSIALLEAMALGIPVVATAIPGNMGLVSHGEHGRLAPPDDPHQLAHAIVEEWRDPKRAIAMALRARARVEAEFSIGAVARKHLRLFERLIRARPTGGRAQGPTAS